MLKNNKVLFVDNEVTILDSIKRSVMHEDYLFLFALNGEKSLEIIKNNNVSVLVIHVPMSNVNILELLNKVKEISPDTLIIVLSEHDDLTQISTDKNSVDVFKYITKPFSNEIDILPTMREALHHYNLKREHNIIKKELKKKNDKYKKLLKVKDELINRSELDILNIKSINNTIIKIQNLLLSNVQSNINYLDASAYYMKMINTLYTKFLATFPTVIDTCNIKSLSENFAASTCNRPVLDTDNLDFNHTGNLKLIFLVTTELCNYLIEKNKVSNLVVQFRSFPMLNIKFISMNEQLFTYNIEFKLITNFLRELIKTCGGNLVLDEKNPNEILILADTKI